MKKIVLLFPALFLLSINAQKGNINVELISYRVPIAYSIEMQANPSSVDAYTIYSELFEAWYRNKFEPAEYDLFIHRIYYAATTGKNKSI